MLYQAARLPYQLITLATLQGNAGLSSLFAGNGDFSETFPLTHHDCQGWCLKRQPRT